MAWYNWSQTSASNASADSSINWAEGQPPSSINDSARAMMSASAKYRDDIAGAIVTGGTSTAYTVTSYSVFDTLAHLNGQIIAFSPHTTSGATVTLNVDGLGAKPLRSSPSTELLAGVLIQGTPYVAVYNNSDGAFYLRGFMGNPYNIPLLGAIEYWDVITPNSSFIFPAGQAISRTTYAAAFARWGTRYGAGDGSTTFNVPDKTGRVSAMLESVGARLTLGNSGIDGGSMGAAGGSQSHTLTASEIPTIISSNPSTVNGTFSSTQTNVVQGTVTSSPNTGGVLNQLNNGATATTITGITSHLATVIAVQSTNTAGASHTIVPPLIVCNYIIRVI